LSSYYCEIKIYLILLITIFPIISFAQEVKGTIVDEIGTPLPGVTIHNLKLDKYATSDFDGNFILQANSGDDIKFTMIGMSDLTLKATSEMKVTMKESTTEFKEVVMIGYGTAKKRDLTGSIVKISGSEVSDKPNTNPMASMQGKVAGLSVVNSGVPGSEPDIRIRGTVSLFQTKPLYVIDGIFNDNMSYINPNDIESIEVLKDPSSLAVFGAKGANGVIIVSTKRAKSGKTTINFNTSLGVKNIVNKPELTNASQFKSLYDMQRANQGASAYPYYNLYTADTDWVNEISNDNAVISMQNLSISNATEKNKIYLGVGYVNEEGLIKNELYKKFTFNLNDELIINDKIKVGVALNGYDARLPQTHSFSTALQATPIVAPFNNAQGVYNQLPTDIGGAQVGNPLLEVEGKKNTYIGRDTRFVGNVFAELKIIDNLKIRGAYLADLNFSNGRGYTPVFNVYAAESDQTTLYGGNALTSVSQYKNDKQNLQQELMLTYNKDFGKHSLTALVGYTRFEEYIVQ